MESLLITIMAGVVVGLVTLLIEYRTRWFARAFSLSQGEGRPSNDPEYRDRPSPREIVKQTDNVPPFQRRAIEESYNGLKVEWRVLFYNAELRAKDQAEITMRDPSGYPWIYCTMDITQHPKIKIVKEGHKMLVRGEISKVGGNTIRLSNCTVQFD